MKMYYAGNYGTRAEARQPWSGVWLVGVHEDAHR